MRIVSLNVNGIRAAARKGFFDWMAASDADVVCLQETRAHSHQRDHPVFHPPGYHAFFHDAERKGYSGVAIYARRQPDRVIEGLGMPEFDREGRYLEVRFGRLRVVSLYVPSGSSSEERQQIKFDFMDRFEPHLRKMRRARSQYIVCGDWNIAHKQIDLKNWRSNRKNSGFLPEERAWMDKLFQRGGEGFGFIDAFRVVNPHPEQYTWWSNRGRAREKNVGWRIDYHVVTPGLKKRVQEADVFKDHWFSDHAPLTIDYDWKLGD